MATRRADLDRLAGELARLSPEERRGVLASLQEHQGSDAEHRGSKWNQVHQVKGLVQLGGNAIEDTDRLYDA